MPNVRVNGISIEYEESGEEHSTPLLPIIGLGQQMVMWREAFCKQLADRGFRVIRYDNRDVGLARAGNARLEAARLPRRSRS